MTSQESSGNSATSATPRRVLVMQEAFADGDKDDWLSWLK